MNKIVFSVCYIGVLLFLSSCANFTEDGSDKTMGFEKIKKLSGQEISINEILNIENFYISHNYVLIQSNTTEKLFYLFEWPSMNFLTSFGNLGNGPSEYVAPTIGPFKGDEYDFCLYDHGKGTLELLKINEDIPINIERKNFDWKSAMKYSPKLGQ